MDIRQAQQLGAPKNTTAVPQSQGRHDHSNGADNCPLCTAQSVPSPQGNTAPSGQRDVIAIQSTPEERLALASEDQTRDALGQEEAIAEGRFSTSLTDGEKREIEELKSRDREVRAHEQAHLSQSGGHATGGASYTYATGPDGKRYAVAGEVPIDVSPVGGNPQATLQKARTIQRAALAPSDPSGADHAIARSASRMATDAQAELAQASSETPEEPDHNKADPRIQAYTKSTEPNDTFRRVG